MTETAETEVLTAANSQDEGWEWAIVEIMGHRRHAGRCREEERFGIKMLRVDVPQQGNPALFGWETHLYTGAAIFSYALTDERSVMKVNAPYAPPHRLIYRETVEAAADDDGDGEFEDRSADPNQTAMDV